MRYRILAVGSVLAGCGARADMAPPSERADVGPASAPAVEMATYDSVAPSDDRMTPRALAGARAESNVTPQAPAPDVVAARMIVRNARLTLQVGDVRRSMAAVGTLATELRGFVGEARQWRDGEADHATLTLRVPAASMDSALSRLRAMAVRVDDETLGGEDVTAQAVDLGAQLTNLRATETELRALLASVRQRTQKASDVLEVHQELSRIRGEIEQRTAQLQSLQRLASLATIHVEFRPDVVAVPVADQGWQPRGVARDAIRTLLSTGRAVADAVIWGGIVGVPALLVLVGVARLARGLWRRLLGRRGSVGPAASAG